MKNFSRQPLETAFLETKKKETKIILRNMYYSLPSKKSILLQVVGEAAKLLPDSAFMNLEIVKLQTLTHLD
jgi:hypothetical protein